MLVGGVHRVGVGVGVAARVDRCGCRCTMVTGAVYHLLMSLCDAAARYRGVWPLYVLGSFFARGCRREFVPWIHVAGCAVMGGLPREKASWMRGVLGGSGG